MNPLLASKTTELPRKLRNCPTCVWSKTSSVGPAMFGMADPSCPLNNCVHPHTRSCPPGRLNAVIDAHTEHLVRSGLIDDNGWPLPGAPECPAWQGD